MENKSLAARIQENLGAWGIVFLCFGYFAAYIPYSMLTKMSTSGLLPGMDGHRGFDGVEIQPVAILASTLGMMCFLTIAGWWKYASHVRIAGLSLPCPKWYTFLSGLCTGGIILTTTLAYTFEGISIVFAMLVMRGGVLVVAPIVDLLAVRRQRKIYWPSWVAAGLSFGALVAAFLGNASVRMTVTAAIDLGLYVVFYFVRFFIMSNYAKSKDVDEKRRYFTEEQLTANVVLPLGLLIFALIGSGMDRHSFGGMLWYGMSVLPGSGYFWYIFLLGFLSYGTGLFGSLIFLDRREHTFTAPANRVSSIFAGVIATCLLAVFYGKRYPDAYQWVGVGLIVAAIFFLAIHSFVEKRKSVA